VNSLFLAKSEFKRVSEGINKKLPIKSDEESSLVDKVIEISNLDLVRDLIEIHDFLNCFPKTIIMQAVYFKIMFSLSYLDVEEI